MSVQLHPGLSESTATLRYHGYVLARQLALVSVGWLLGAGIAALAEQPFTALAASLLAAAVSALLVRRWRAFRITLCAQRVTVTALRGARRRTTVYALPGVYGLAHERGPLDYLLGTVTFTVQTPAQSLTYRLLTPYAALHQLLPPS